MFLGFSEIFNSHFCRVFRTILVLKDFAQFSIMSVVYIFWICVLFIEYKNLSRGILVYIWTSIIMVAFKSWIPDFLLVFFYSIYTKKMMKLLDTVTDGSLIM